MQGDEIREQIEALRQEVRGLSNSITNLRQDDMRKVFGDQIRPVLTDRIARHYSRMPEGIEEEGIAREKLVALVERSITIFQREGKRNALKFVDDQENDLSWPSGNGDWTGTFEFQIVSQIREYFELSDTIFNKTVSEVPVAQPGRDVAIAPLTPDAVERMLAPLSNARRVQVLLLLSQESNSLAGLCKVLDLKKGHLQFHLKALLEADYVRFDRKSRLYSVSPRGTFMLDGVARLFGELPAGNAEGMEKGSR